MYSWRMFAISINLLKLKSNDVPLHLQSDYRDESQRPLGQVSFPVNRIPEHRRENRASGLSVDSTKVLPRMPEI